MSGGKKQDFFICRKKEQNGSQTISGDNKIWQAQGDFILINC